MKEAKWAELLAMLMKYASEIFASLEGFRSGKLIVEADAEKQQLQIVISKDASEQLNIDFNLIPKKETVEAPPEKPTEETTPVVPEEAKEEKPVEEEKKTEEEIFEIF